MEQAMHAARLVAAQSALLALLSEQQGENLSSVDGITVTLSNDAQMGRSLDVIYTDKGRPVGGEGI
jgi:hypothetical protein